MFSLAHKLVDLYPEWSVAWFAVGCYYFSVGKHEMARNHFCKATQLDRCVATSKAAQTSLLLSFVDSEFAHKQPWANYILDSIVCLV